LAWAGGDIGKLNVGDRQRNETSNAASSNGGSATDGELATTRD
jgi:hypothetical protein